MTSRQIAAVSALVLAAGASTRLGEPKQSVLLDGQSLLTRAAKLASSCVDGCVQVVVGANATADRQNLAHVPAEVYEFDDWEQGQSASLSFGLARIPHGHAALVLVVDQYRLNTTHLRTLVDAWRGRPERPAAACYARTRGVPVVWPSKMVEMLLSGRCLGRDVLGSVRCTEVLMPAAGFDLDTPQDLAQLRRFERSPGG